jgi:hypothetical protein
MYTRTTIKLIASGKRECSRDLDRNLTLQQALSAFIKRYKMFIFYFSYSSYAVTMSRAVHCTLPPVTRRLIAN